MNPYNLEYHFSNGEYVACWEEENRYWVKCMWLDEEGDFNKFKTGYEYRSYAENRFYQELGKLHYKRVMERIALLK